MSWTEREAVTNFVSLGSEENQTKQAGGLLLSIKKSPKYEKQWLYELVKQDGEVITLAGNADINAKLSTEDIGSFVKCTYQGKDGNRKKISVLVYEGELTDAMKAWPKFKEAQAAKSMIEEGPGAEPEDTGSQGESDIGLPF